MRTGAPFERWLADSPRCAGRIVSVTRGTQPGHLIQDPDAGSQFSNSLSLRDIVPHRPSNRAAGLGLSALADAPARVSRALALEADRALKDRLQRAEVVVSGEVSSVRKLESGERGGPPGRLSEHDPQWREAVIDVRQVMKDPAMGPDGRAAVRFPGSSDVMWAAAPKFEVGQQGIFILSASDVTSMPQPRQRVEFTSILTDPADYLATGEEERLRNLMRPQASDGR